MKIVLSISLSLFALSTTSILADDPIIDLSFLKEAAQVEEVEPESETEEEKENKVYFFTASWCGPCQSFKRNELPKLKNANIEIYDIEDNPEFYNEWKKADRYIPLFIFLNTDGKEYYRVTGYQKSSKIIEILENQ